MQTETKRGGARVNAGRYAHEHKRKGKTFTIDERVIEHVELHDSIRKVIDDFETKILGDMAKVVVKIKTKANGEEITKLGDNVVRKVKGQVLEISDSIRLEIKGVENPIKLSDLKEGNYVRCGGEVCQVSHIKGGLVYLNYLGRTFIVDPKTIEGINIDIKWLVRFGFERVKYTDVYTKDKGSICVNIKKQIICWLTNEQLIKVDYVHKLQNAYLKLTEKPLKFKENESVS